MGRNEKIGIVSVAALIGVVALGARLDNEEVNTEATPNSTSTVVFDGKSSTCLVYEIYDFPEDSIIAQNLLVPVTPVSINKQGEIITPSPSVEC